MRFTLTLVRHGESEANVRHMLSGWMDVDLTENGKKELRELRRSVEYPESEAYFCSPLKRCKDTFRILFPDKCPTISDEYKEINFRTLEGHILPTKEEIYVAEEPRGFMDALTKPPMRFSAMDCPRCGCQIALAVRFPRVDLPPITERDDADESEVAEDED